MFELVAEVVVGVEGAEGAELGILQQHHGFGPHAHTHQRDDVGMVQLGENGHLRKSTEREREKRCEV